MFLVLGFRGAWVSHAPSRVPKQRRPQDAALPPGSGSRLAGSPAWHGLPQCPGYGHWVSYCSVVFVFWSRFCLGWGFSCAPPLLTAVFGCVSVPVRAPLVPRHFWLGCAAWLCVLGLGFRLRSATPGWGVGYVCVCVPAPLVLRHSWLGCVMWVCVWGLVSAAPRHSWLGCWGVCVYVCPLRLYPATPSWGVWRGCVCSGLDFGCAPPLLAGVLGCVCVCVPATLVPCHSWLGCVVCGVVPCAQACVSAAPCLSWLECWGVCVFVCPLCLYPATPG